MIPTRRFRRADAIRSHQSRPWKTGGYSALIRRHGPWSKHWNRTASEIPSVSLGAQHAECGLVPAPGRRQELKTKVALQQAGVIGTAKANAASGGKLPETSHQTTESSPPAAGRAAANLKRDARAAATLDRANGHGADTPVDRVLEQPESRVSEEGTNMLLQEVRAECTGAICRLKPSSKSRGRP